MYILLFFLQKKIIIINNNKKKGGKGENLRRIHKVPREKKSKIVLLFGASFSLFHYKLYSPNFLTPRWF